MLQAYFCPKHRLSPWGIRHQPELCPASAYHNHYYVKRQASCAEQQLETIVGWGNRLAPVLPTRQCLSAKKLGVGSRYPYFDLKVNKHDEGGRGAEPCLKAEKTLPEVHGKSHGGVVTNGCLSHTPLRAPSHQN
jgi:hypothetical protein